MTDSDFDLFSSLRYDPILTTQPLNLEFWDPPASSPSPFYMARYHQDRMLQAAQHFNWPAAITTISGPQGFRLLLRKLSEAIDLSSPTPLRIRTLLSKEGVLKIEWYPTGLAELVNLFPNRLPPPSSVRQAVPEVSSLTGGALKSDDIYGDPPLTNPFLVIPDTKPTPRSSYTSYKTTSRGIYDDARLRVGIKGRTERREVLLYSDKDGGAIMEGSLTSPYFWREGKWTTPPVASGGQIGTTRRWAIERGFAVEGVVKAGELVDGEECWISNGVMGFQWGRVKLS
ncbi:aminodeoxychorismate lyase [Amylocarpus encephaloides]|uniref:Aminodeoxychorismate lyase n=1 Tax=Amylocarpus encephaloides TaxID=45428 RepID=A0A9P7YTT0_9HELO|nr:aminodeoxychorismate lyase [Amylocarpus encephaloides]